MKIVYSYYVLDIVHKGHLMMMRNAKAIAGEDGKLIVGILTDEAVMEKKSKPLLSFEDRTELAAAIKYVDVVVAQETYSPLQNVMRIRPDILIESSSHAERDIEKARKVMEEINGSVIVLPYFPGHSSTNIKNKISRISRDKKIKR
jgi:phosphoenolpyruvate phosphomutase